MIRKRIAIVRGGPSSEYEVSLKSGKHVAAELSDDFHVVDVVIDKAGVWHISGLPRDPHEALAHVDIVFNAMHGEYGEDGKFQNLMENLGKPYTGSGPLGAAMSMNKEKAKEMFKKVGLKTPVHKTLSRPESEGGLEFQAMLVFRNFTMPVIVKPINKGSSIGVSKAHNFDELKTAMSTAYSFSEKILVEEFIEGKEATVGVVENFRGEKLYSFMPVEIEVPKQKKLFDYETKLSAETRKKTPGNFNREESKLLQDAARAAHEVLGLRHYSRSDFIVHPRRGVYILETNALPDISRDSTLHHSLQAVGMSYKDFLLHVINLLG